jgi:hypothetical protein
MGERLQPSPVSVVEQVVVEVEKGGSAFILRVEFTGL